MSLVNDEHNLLSALRLLGRQQLDGLGNKVGTLKARGCTQCPDDLDVDSPHACSWLGKVDQGMPAGVKGCGGGPYGHGLAGANFTREHTHGPLGDQPCDASECLGVGLGAVEHTGSQFLAEGHAGEAVVGTQAIDAHGWSSSFSSSLWG